MMLQRKHLLRTEGPHPSIAYWNMHSGSNRAASNNGVGGFTKRFEVNVDSSIWWEATKNPSGVLDL